MLFSCSHLHGSVVVDPRVLGQTSGSNGRGQKHENGSQIIGPLESKSLATLCRPIPGSTQSPSRTQEGHGMKDCSPLIHDSLIHSVHTLFPEHLLCARSLAARWGCKAKMDTASKKPAVWRRADLRHPAEIAPNLRQLRDPWALPPGTTGKTQW